MKKILSSIITIVLIISTFNGLSFATITEEKTIPSRSSSISLNTGKIGDVDQNGQIDAQDAVMILKYVAHNITLSEEALKVANADGIGDVDAQDAVMILKYVAHNITEFPNDIIEEKNTKTAIQAVEEMKIGWNLGNTLDACDYQKRYLGEEMAIEYYETVWGNPITTKEMIKEIKMAGFESVRIPVTYYDHIKADGTIDARWFTRVKEVVQYVLDYNMYCILDVHHDTGLYSNGSWIVADADKYEENAKKLERLWTQIAKEFKDYDYKLVFEGFNEIVDTNKNYDWQTGYYNTINVNKLNQVFVDTVRKTGGKNKDRFLAVTTFGGITDEQKLSTFIMPKDSAEDKIILALHDYANTESNIDSFLSRIKKYCIDKNIPVILDEFGTEQSFASEERRAEIAKYYISNAKKIGIACFWWDNGNSREYMLFNRRSLSWEYPRIKNAMISCFE